MCQHNGERVFTIDPQTGHISCNRTCFSDLHPNHFPDPQLPNIRRCAHPKSLQSDVQVIHHMFRICDNQEQIEIPLALNHNQACQSTV